MKAYLLVAALLACTMAPSDGSATIIVSLGSSTVATGGTASVDLRISGLTPGTTALGTYDVNLAFDPALVAFQSVTYGDTLLGNQLDLLGFGSLQVTTPGSGIVNLFELSFDTPSALLGLQASSFTLATLSFLALAEGGSPLALSVNALGDQNGDVLGASLQDGSIAVSAPTSAVPEPASAALLGLGLVGVWASRRRVPATARRDHTVA
jgi:hypothetical protein